MQVRHPAVAGMFYEASADGLRRQVSACFDANDATAAREPFIGGVVPHAGLMYSGHVAAAFYANADLPRRFIILCPNHTGLGHFAAINREGAWRTPLGDAVIDSALADQLIKRAPVLRVDAAAHSREHSLEVQLPFLQHQLRDFTFVPICLGAPRYDVCEQIANAIAEIIAESDDRIAIVASSDLNHYESQDVTLRKDQLAIDQIVGRDPEKLWRIIDDENISMCGYIPATTMLIAANRLGASRARLLKHATSGDINRDHTRVVGYAAIIVQ
ncbi:MAG TPA: AmmeMemoRadiSam system protein B [Thermoanaerobaculia bacterium]